MSKSEFFVWCPDLGESRDDARSIEAYDFEEAARIVVERSYHDDPFDSAMEVLVEDGDGETEEWSVCAEPSVTFYSHRLAVNGPSPRPDEREIAP